MAKNRRNAPLNRHAMSGENLIKMSIMGFLSPGERHKPGICFSFVDQYK